MSFELRNSMAIKAVKISTKEKEGRLVRRCKLTLSARFDEEIAAALGSDAEKARKSLEKGGLEKAVMPIDAVVVDAILKSDGKSITIREITGTKATGKCGSPEGEDEESDGKPATIALEFDFAWSAESWGFLGKHCSEMVSVDLVPVQGQLKANGESIAKKTAKNGASNGHGKHEQATKGKRGKAKTSDLKLERDEDAPPLGGFGDDPEERAEA